MDYLLNWIKGIMGCLLVMSLVLQCVPGKVYRPYLRLFMGIVLILTVLSPLTDLTGFGKALETMVGELAYREEIPGWEEKLMKGDEWAEEQIIAKAEEMSREAEENWLTDTETEDSRTEKSDRSEGQSEQQMTENDGSREKAGSRAAEIQVEVEIEDIQPVVISGGGQDEDT